MKAFLIIISTASQKIEGSDNLTSAVCKNKSKNVTVLKVNSNDCRSLCGDTHYSLSNAGIDVFWDKVCSNWTISIAKSFSLSNSV